MKRLLVLVPAVVLAGCIDLEGAYASCIDGGCRSATTDAGADAGLDAGADASVDAGVDAGPLPYDGGASCTGSTRPRLRCGGEVTLSTSSSGAGALSASDGGFFVGWLGATVQLRHVGLDGSVSVVGLDAGAATALALDARGDQWAVVWLNNGPASCATSAGSTSVSSPDGGYFSAAAVAVDGQGRVFVNATTYGALALHAAEAAGCPSAVLPVPMGAARADGVAAVTTTSGFRNVWTFHPNGIIAYTTVSGLTRDGGFVERSLENQSAVETVSAAVSADGAGVFSAAAALSSGDLEVTLSPADLTRNGAGLFVDGGQNTLGWNASHCGPGCLATVSFEDRVTAPARVTFFREAPLRQLSSWDAVCSLPITTSTSVALAPAADGRLGVLTTTANAVKLYFCDVPPLD